jgi:hypothetical protein
MSGSGSAGRLFFIVSTLGSRGRTGTDDLDGVVGFDVRHNNEPTLRS